MATTRPGTTPTTPPAPAGPPRTAADQRIPSSPRLYRLVWRAFALGSAALLVAAALVPAPLGGRADPGHVPNPVKAAWFLVWIQEVVSYAVEAIWAVVAVSLLVVLWPYLDRGPRFAHARWRRPEARRVRLVGLLIVIVVVALTAVGEWFRGADWQLIWPF